MLEENTFYFVKLREKLELFSVKTNDDICGKSPDYFLKMTH